MINIKGIKIRVKDKEENIKVQKRLFELGAVWASGERTPQLTDKNFLFCEDNKSISFTQNEETFLEDDEFKEIEINDLFPSTFKKLLED